MHSDDLLFDCYQGISAIGKVGAFEIMALRGKITPLAGDSKELNMKCDKLMDKQDSPEYKRLCFKERENWLLTFASKLSTPINYAVYGCNHNFIDNVDEWNQTNDNKFY